MAGRAKLLITKDLNGVSTWGISSPLADDQNYTTALAADTPQSLAIPDWANSFVCSFSVGSDVYVNQKTTAAVPSGSFTANFDELNPMNRICAPGGNLSFICATTASVQVYFFEQRTY